MHIPTDATVIYGLGSKQPGSVFMTSIEMIAAARARLQGHIRRTPLLSSPFFDEMAGRRVFVKAECLQHTGSFKFRGGWSALSGLGPQVRSRGVIAFSSGNHAQGVALAGTTFPR